MAAMPDGEIFTVQIVAEFLMVDQVTIRALLRDGTLEGFRVGKQWRVTREALARFMERKPEPSEMQQDEDERIPEDPS